MLHLYLVWSRCLSCHAILVCISVTVSLCAREKNIFLQPKYFTSGDEGGMATLQLGHLEEFQPEEDSIASYLERVELYFVINDTNSDKKVPVFLSAVGA